MGKTKIEKGTALESTQTEGGATTGASTAVGGTEMTGGGTTMVTEGGTTEMDEDTSLMPSWIRIYTAAMAVIFIGFIILVGVAKHQEMKAYDEYLAATTIATAPPTTTEVPITTTEPEPETTTHYNADENYYCPSKNDKEDIRWILYNRKCYAVIKNPENVPDSSIWTSRGDNPMLICANYEQSFLASIHSETVDLLLSGFIATRQPGGGKTTFGLDRLIKEAKHLGWKQKYKWVDGGPHDYELNWAKGQPDDSAREYQEGCVGYADMYKKDKEEDKQFPLFTVDDYQCGTMYVQYVVCERKASPYTV